MMTTTTVYLDFDDCINFFGNKNKHRKNTGFTQFKTTSALVPCYDSSRTVMYYDKYKIHYTPEVVETLENLSAQGDIKIVWLTTWQELIYPVSQRIGFTQHRVLTLDTALDVNTAKRQAIVQDVISGNVRKLVWVDDSAIGGLTPEELFLPEQSLLVEPPVNKWGLTQTDIFRIKDFVTNR